VRFIFSDAYIFVFTVKKPSKKTKQSQPVLLMETSSALFEPSIVAQPWKIVLHVFLTQVLWLMLCGLG